jgi:hypothetical protein
MRERVTVMTAVQMARNCGGRLRPWLRMADDVVGGLVVR